MNADQEGARLRALWTGNRRTTSAASRVTIIARRRGEPDPLVLTSLKLESRRIEFQSTDRVEAGDRLELRLLLGAELTVCATARVERLEARNEAFRRGQLVLEGAPSQFQALCEFLGRIA